MACGQTNKRIAHAAPIRLSCYCMIWKTKADGVEETVRKLVSSSHQPSAWGERTPVCLRCERPKRIVPPGSPDCIVESVLHRECLNRNTKHRRLAMGLQSALKEVHMEVYIGIDWSQSKHDVAMMNEAGAVVVQGVIAHSEEGFLKLELLRRRLGVQPEQCMVGLETAHNLLIDFLWSRNYSHVYVVPPNVVKSNRGRYRQSGARSDASDAVVLADLLRTDRGRLQPWHPDSALTCQIRAKVSLICFLTREIVALSNRLRASLLRYYPAAVSVFSSLRTRIALQFIQAYPTPEAAAALTFSDFASFARQHGYHRPKDLPACFERLQAGHPPTMAHTLLAYKDEGPFLAQRLLQTLEAKASLLSQLQLLFQQHPDYPVFSSLPGAGQFLAPALLAKFGDDRQRFPTPGAVQALAGTCPVTDSSGQYKVIRFRYACDHEFRHITQQWAVAATWHSPWARGYWQQVRPRCRSDSQAYRCLANRLLAIAWKLWQTRKPYDEAYHWQQCILRRKPRENS